MQYVIRNTYGELLLDQVKIADSFWKRFWGLMGKGYLPQGEGLLLKRVKAVHTCFMRFPIEVIYLDGEYHVIAKEMLHPWRCGRILRKAAHVLEVGSLDGERFLVGMELEVIKREWDRKKEMEEKRGGAPWKNMDEMN